MPVTENNNACFKSQLMGEFAGKETHRVAQKMLYLQGYLYFSSFKVFSL